MAGANGCDMNRSASRLWRVVALVAVVANIAVNYLYERLGLTSIAEVSARYDNVFMPAGYAFSIWGVIHVAFVLFAVQSLRRPHRDDAAIDRLTPMLALANLLTSVWVVVFSYDQIWLSVAVNVAILAVAITMFVRASHAVAGGRSMWLRVPFSLFLGWISVAVIANVAAALTASDFGGGPINAPGWAIIMIIVAAALGAGITLRYRAPTVAAVVAWAAFALHVAAGDSHPDVGAVALAATVVEALIAAVVLAMLANSGSRRWRAAIQH